MLIGPILQIFASLISLIELKERRKYVDKKLALEAQYYEEYNKPEDQIDDAMLDSIEFQLISLIQAMAAELQTK
ncbi:MAG TPA: hypothetical protein PK473_03080 [Nitrosomonas sp.]|nr:hypothetical protein [Agitococcus sp.]HNA69994.1 hypothetical protein [Nitrosomonas sp.]